MIFNEQIYYSVAGISDALDKLRQFAIAQGWTADYWQPSSVWNTSSPYGWKAGTETHLQLYSPGYGNQAMVYRFRALPSTSDLADCTLYPRITKSEDRHHDPNISTSPISQDTYGCPTNYTDLLSTPVSTFDALYLYGNIKHISMILKVTSGSVIHITLGTAELFKSWEHYENGLALLFSPSNHYTGYTDRYKWYNIDAWPTYWYCPFSSFSYRSTFENADGDQGLGTLSRNYKPTATSTPQGATGGFNNMIEMLCFNTFTDKRLAFQSTLLIQDPVSGTYWPMGKSPFAWINGTNLTFGQEVSFGTEKYKCYPSVNIGYQIWIAFRTV